MSATVVAFVIRSSKMRRKTYCCDATRHMYENYYANQSGSGMPVFVGRRHQRGHGLGQTISGLFKRFVIPFVAPRAKEVGKKILGNVVKTGMEVAGDVFSGRSAKESLKERGLAGIKRTFGDIVRQSSSGNNRVDITAARAAPKRSRQTVDVAKKKKKKKKVVAKPKSKDIFG